MCHLFTIYHLFNFYRYVSLKLKLVNIALVINITTYKYYLFPIDFENCV